MCAAAVQDIQHVIPGLDPGIHLLRRSFFAKWMDCRVKPGNDESD
jgi:hypothetical protein